MPEIPFAFQCSIDENQLLSLKDSINRCLKTTSVSNIPEFEYYLQIYPNGHNEERRGHTGIYLHLEFKNVKKVEADFTFTIESSNYSRTGHFIYEQSQGFGRSVCSTEQLFDPEKKFIIDGKFVIKVNGIFKFENEDAISMEDKQKWSAGEFGDESWKRDDTKDFAVIVGDKEIKVHKFILGVRSDVFTAMFNSMMKEAKENKVSISDFSYNVVETALKLIYECNFTSSLTLDELIELQRFFDKYQLTSLKAKIEPLLIAQVSASTVCRLTNCSILTNSSKLKQKCMEFLSAAFKSQIPLADFKTLDKDIVFEVLENSFYQHLDIKK